MNKNFISVFILLLALVAPASSMIFRTPEEQMDKFFRNWKLQNQTYMESVMSGELTSFGKLMSRQYLMNYTIEWSDKYRDLTITKVKTKLKSIEYGLQNRNFYFFFKKIDGSWKMLNGFQVERNISAKEAYNLFIWINIY